MSTSSKSIEKLENNQVKLTIEVSAEKFEEGMNKAYLKNAKYFNIPGFRKGKAPRNVIERYYGEKVFFEDAFNEVAPEAYDKAIEENSVQAVSHPEIDIVQIGSGNDLIFTAVVDIKPEVEINEYKGIKVAKKEYPVTDEAIEHELGHMAEKNARLIDVDDRELKEGDTATIDFEGFIDGVAFEGGKAKNYSLEIGSHSFIEGFESQLVGMKIGDERDINVTFPEEYFSKDLAGKPATFKVTLHSIKVKELPAIDDEFAKDVSEFDTLKEMKASMKEKLEKHNAEKAEHEMYEEVAQKICENAKVNIPKSMIEAQIDQNVKDFESNLQSKGLELKTYLEYLGQDLAKFREQFREQSRQSVLLELVLDAIATKENIDVTDKELDDKIDELAKEYSKDPEEVKSVKSRITAANEKAIKEKLRVEKTLKWVYSNAVFEEVKEDSKEASEKNASSEKKATKKAESKEEKVTKEAKVTKETKESNEAEKSAKKSESKKTDKK